MKDLKHWKEKIQDRRKTSEFTDFMKEIGSWIPLTFYRHDSYVTKIPPTERKPNIVSLKKFEENRDNLLKTWIDYDENTSFWKNYENLFYKIDIAAVIDYGSSQNSDYADMVLESKNVYLTTVVITECENVMYSFSVKGNSSNVINGLAVRTHSDNVYFCSWVVQSYKVFYSRFINNCNNVWFSSNMNWCSECIFSNDLDNATYYIKNIKYKKEEYFQEKERLLKDKMSFSKLYWEVSKAWKNIASTDVKWSAIFNSENVKNGYHVDNLKNGRNLILVWGRDGNENMYDVFPGWSPIANDFYGVMWANWEHLYCCINIVTSSNMFYSRNCVSSSYCIWCIGLKNAQYCIFNKQYTKDQWNILADKIFWKMEEDWILWEFFPGSVNPFYFNDTMASLLGKFTEKEIKAEWYLWRNEDIKVDIPEWSDLITIAELENFQWYNDDWNWDINPDIMKKVIKDNNWNYYRIVKMEYDFLMKHALPLPDIHWIDRIKVNFGI